MIRTKHTPRLTLVPQLAFAVSGLLCLAPPTARAAGPTIYSVGMASGSTLITFSDGISRPARLPGSPLGSSFHGPADAPAPDPIVSASVYPGGIAGSGYGPHFNGIPNSPKQDFVPEPSETTALSLGAVMLGGLALLARKRRTAQARRD